VDSCEREKGTNLSSIRGWGAGLAIVLAACDSATSPSGEVGPTLIPSFAPTQNITVADLGSLGSGAVQVAQALNAKGNVAGTSTDGLGRQRAFYWTATGGMVDVGTTGGAQARAFDLNDYNVVVGWSEDAGGNQETFTWSPAVGRRALGRFGGLASAGLGINNKGAVAGYYLPTASTVRGFSRTQSGAFTQLPTLGSSESWAMHLNDAGEVVGISSTSDSATSPYVSFRWTAPGGIRNLGSMGASFSEHDALRINEFGQIAGGAFNTTTGLWHPFIWHSSTGFMDLKTRGFDAARSGIAYGINKFGHVAVLILEPDGTRTPAVWVNGVGVIALPNLGGADGEVWDINDLGMIVGWSLAGSGAMRSTRWQLVFAPSERIQDAINVLQTVADTTSSSTARNRLEDAIDELDRALSELAETPPDTRRAMSRLEDAAQDLESAIRYGYIDPNVGVALAEVVVQAARDMAVAAIDAAKARGGRPGRIADAEELLADGDAQRAGGDYDDAVDRYRDALIQAENA
jgi:probable HAF family extracellular repeat protein